MSFQDDPTTIRWRLHLQSPRDKVYVALKAAVDFGVDLRAHDPSRKWESGYAEN